MKNPKEPQIRLQQGFGAVLCMECGAEIPRMRREAMPRARLCIVCQEAQDRNIARFCGIRVRRNRNTRPR
jgi:RNA polymerase-binding transcription factor DksA